MAKTAARDVPRPDELWTWVRSEFDQLSPDWVHLGTSQFIASHPRMVRQAIEKYKKFLDENPVLTVERYEDRMHQEVRKAAAGYLGVTDPNEFALTDSTTMALGLLYSGFPFREGDEILISRHEHYSHREAVRGASLCHKVMVNTVRLYDGSAADVTADGLVERVLAHVSDRTRMVAATWVHSETGLKFPVRRLADVLADINRGRDPERRVRLVVDGVHGFGIETDTLADLGADFFASGTHKWLYGPRGTGVLWMRLDDWRHMRPVVPAFSEMFDAYTEERPLPPMDGRHFTPGGFHSFEHRWATIEAFAFHEKLGRERVAARVHELNRLCKEGLAAMDHVILHTPMSDELSAGIIAFEIRGMSTMEARDRLRQQRIIATVAPYPTGYLRFTPGIYNTVEDVEAGLEAVRSLA